MAREMVVKNVADLGSLKVGYGDHVQTQGYYAAGDGGSNLFRFQSTVFTPDGGFNIGPPPGVTGTYVAVDQSVFNAKQWGCRGDGVTDDVARIETMLAATPLYGADVWFPPGKYILNSAVDIPQRWFLTIRGSGMGPGTDVSVPLTDPTKGTLFYCPNAASGFKLTRTAGTTYFDVRFRDFSVRAVNTYAAVAGFRLDTAGSTNFARDFTWEHVGIVYFQHAILVEDSGASADKAWGIFRIHRCRIQTNKSILVTKNNCRINHLIFTNNEAGGNNDASKTYSEGRIDVTASTVNISDNVLEGTNNPINLQTCDSGVQIKNNHLEAVTGDYIAKLTNCYLGSIDLQPNLWPNTIGSTVADGVIVNNSRGNVRSLGAVKPMSSFLLPESVHALANHRMLSDTSTVPLHFATWPQACWCAQPKVDQLDFAQPYDERIADGPFGTPVRGYHETATTHIDAMGTLTYAPGDWVFASFLVRRNVVNTTQSRLKCNLLLYSSAGVFVNTGTAGQSLNIEVHSTAIPDMQLTGQWIFYAMGWRSSITGWGGGQNVHAQLIPYDEIGNDWDITGLTFYKVADPNDWRPFIPADYLSTVKTGTAAPVAGTWLKGDCVINSDPASGEPSMWHCSVAGTPGTWIPSANIP